jgi:hypothetical protein
MKRILSITVVAASLTACGGSSEEEKHSQDSTAQVTMDSTMNTWDTTGPNSSLRGDSTTYSGSHGQGSGSRVGGGVSGGAQGQSSDSSKK